MATKLLLVEFAAVDRFHRALSFPFLKGWGARRGVEVLWLRFGLLASVQFEQGTAGIGLDGTDRDSLLRTLSEARPTEVLFDRLPAAGLAAQAHRCLPSARLGFLAEETGAAAPAEDGGPLAPLRLGSERDLERWLGLAERGKRSSRPRSLFEAGAPHYGWVAGNDRARTCQPLPFVVCGRECGYERPLRANPFFRRAGLGRGGIRTGCAFCRRPRGERLWQTPPLVLAERQLRAIRDTHPPFPVRPAVRVCGEAPFFAIAGFARLLRRLAFPPADFLFDARADRIVRHQEGLRAALRAISGTGHRLHIGLVGIENFSADELARLNKGTSPAVNLAAIELLLRLEREHPDAFGVREHGGMSMIAFTPWTTRKDLLINTAVFRQLRLGGLCGKFFTSRLRLYPELPLAARARRDGLLIARYRDPLLDTARRNFYAEELPWRFRHPELEAVNRIFTRLPKDQALARDPLYARVQTWLRGAPAARDTLAQAAHAVAAAAPARPVSAPLLLRRADLRGGARGTGAGRPGSPGNAEASRELAGPPWSWARIEVELGLKPVRRIEEVDAAHLARCRAEPGAFPNLAVYERPDAGFDLFFGPDRDCVAEALDLTGRFQKPDPRQPAETRALVARIGVLLGYPDCCSRAFAAQVEAAGGSNEWLWLARRVAVPGRIPAEMHPGVMQHVPCSVTCAASLSRARRVLGFMRRRYGGALAAETLARLCDPSFMLLDAPGVRAVLSPRTRPCERFRYRARAGPGLDPRLRPVGAGDELLLEPGCATVLRRGRELAHFPLNAFLWWQQRAFHADFWAPCAALKFRQDPEAFVCAAPAASAGSGGAAWSRQSLALKSAVSALLARAPAPRFAGYGLGPLQASEQPRLALTLVKGPERILLFLERRETARHAYASAGGYVLTFANDTPLDSAEKKLAVAEFSRHLAGLCANP